MAGAWIVDVSDPSHPATLAKVETDLALPAHTFKPHPGLVDGRHLSLVGPETFAGEPSGAYVLADTTDPAHPVAIGSWRLPGDLTNGESLLWSPHELTLPEGKAYVSQFHGGAGVLSLRGGRLAPVAWRAAAFPGVGKGARWASDVETFVRHGDYAYAVDMDGGLLVLRETGWDAGQPRSTWTRPSAKTRALAGRSSGRSERPVARRAARAAGTSLRTTTAEPAPGGAP